MVVYKKIALVFLALLPILFSNKLLASEKKIGIIMTGDIPYYKEIHKTFMETLSTKGYGPGKIEIILQTPAPAYVPWSNAAKKLVAYEMDVIVTYGTPATISVLKETSSIPVVFAGVYEPEVFNIRGKNVTGISSNVPIITAIKYLKSLVPFTRLGIVFNDSELDTVKQADDVKGLETQFGFQSVPFNIKKPEDAFKISGIEAVFFDIKLCGKTVPLQCFPGSQKT